MMFFIILFMLGIVFVINPSITMKIATFVGVGRGVDLVIYLLLLVFFFLFIALFYKSRNIDKTLIDLIRKIAIKEAKKV